MVNREVRAVGEKFKEKQYVTLSQVPFQISIKGNILTM